LKRRVEGKRAEANGRAQQAALQSTGAKSVDAIRTRAVEYIRRLKKPEAKKTFHARAKTGPELVGDFAKALAEEWSDDPSASFDDLDTAGRALGDAFSNPVLAQAKNKELLAVVEKLEQKYRSSQRSEGLRNLRSLCNTLEASFGDAGAMEKEVAQLQSLAEAAEREAKAWERLPLLTSKNPPPGDYTLIARLGDMDALKLCTFSVK
jgi:hypothetical protein